MIAVMVRSEILDFENGNRNPADVNRQNGSGWAGPKNQRVGLGLEIKLLITANNLARDGKSCDMSWSRDSCHCRGSQARQ